jgi:hypothetical protein
MTKTTTEPTSHDTKTLDHPRALFLCIAKILISLVALFSSTFKNKKIHEHILKIFAWEE